MTAVTAASAPGAAAWRGTRRGTAFGLDIDSDFPVLGLDTACPGAREADRLCLRLARRDAVLAAWPDAEAEELLARRDALGRRWLALDAHRSAGWLLAARGHGVAHVARDAETATYAPVRVAAWRWQRHLAGQVLPLVSLLRGKEILHAGAVVVGGRAIVVSGGSAAGKSTLLAALLLRGARFLADDVVALEGLADRLVAHPGLGAMNLRAEAVSRLPVGAVAAIGVELGRDVKGHRVVPARHPGAAPVGGLYVLDRSAEHHSTRIVEAGVSAARLVLASTFNAVIRTPERLLRHLDVSARLDRSATVAEVRAPLEADPLLVADTVLEHAAGRGAD